MPAAIQRVRSFLISQTRTGLLLYLVERSALAESGDRSLGLEDLRERAVAASDEELLADEQEGGERCSHVAHISNK